MSDKQCGDFAKGPIVLTREQADAFNAFMAAGCPAAPRWLPRPDGPGWWFWDLEGEITLIRLDAERIELYQTNALQWRWFGPIPEPPKEPSDA